MTTPSQLPLFGATPSPVQILRDAQAVESPLTRLRRCGVGSLALDELYQLILGLDDPLLAARVVARWGTLDELAHADVFEVEAIEGMTPARATRLLAAAELTRRTALTENPRPRGMSPNEIAHYLEPQMLGLAQEIFVVVLLDTKMHIKGVREIYRGNINSTPVLRVAEVFRPAIVASVLNIVVAHNHPSGDPTPSPDDVDMTRILVQAGKQFDIEVIDHLIFGERGKFKSLKGLGLGGLA
jgi:DNA repair protein RadC